MNCINIIVHYVFLNPLASEVLRPCDARLMRCYPVSPDQSRGEVKRNQKAHERTS